MQWTTEASRLPPGICKVSEFAKCVFHGKLIRSIYLLEGQELAKRACSDTTRPAYITTTNYTLIETIDYPNEHPDNNFCEWIIQPDNVT